MPVPFDADGGFWLFGYGSLIWNPDVPFDDRRPARLRGWARRFWQGSHDHRGTPEAPGRVVTLIEAGDAFVDGLAFRIPGGEAKEILARLDHREKNGYARHALARFVKISVRGLVTSHGSAPMTRMPWPCRSTVQEDLPARIANTCCRSMQRSERSLQTTRTYSI